MQIARFTAGLVLVLSTGCAPGRFDTPGGGAEPRSDGYLIREAALVARVPCITTIAAATAATRAIADARVDTMLSLQERIDVETDARAA